MKNKLITIILLMTAQIGHAMDDIEPLFGDQAAAVLAEFNIDDLTGSKRKFDELAIVSAATNAFISTISDIHQQPNDNYDANNNNDDDDDDDTQQNNNIVVAPPQALPLAAALAVVQNICDICGESWPSLRSLSVHIRSHAPHPNIPRPHVCNQPGCRNHYEYKSKTCLKNHLLTHHRIVIPGGPQWMAYAQNYLSKPHRIVKKKQRPIQQIASNQEATANNNNSNDK
jgi:hypothetical protein